MNARLAAPSVVRSEEYAGDSGFRADNPPYVKLDCSRTERDAVRFCFPWGVVETPYGELAEAVALVATGSRERS